MPTEILAERTRFTKTFILDESTRRIEFSTTPLHYRDKDGQWKDIRTAFLDEGRRFANRENILKSMIAPEGITLENEEGDSLTFRVKELRYVSPSGRVDLVAPAGPPVYRGLHTSISGEQYVVHTGFLPGVFSEYTVGPARVKHNLYILRPIRKPSFSGPYWLELVFSITGSAALEFVRYGEVIEDEVASVDDLEIRFGEERIFRLPAPFLTDNNGNRFPVRQKIQRLSPSEAMFSYLISSAVLGRQDLVYPLLIDPTVSVSGQGSGQEKTWPCQYIHTVSWQCSIYGHSATYATNTGYFRITMANGTVKVDRSKSGSGSQSYSGTFTPLSQELGTCRIRVWGSNQYSGGSGSVTYQVDETAPTISFSSSSRSWGNSNVSVTVTLSDSQSGVDAYRYAWSTSTSKPSSGWTNWTTGSSFSATQSSDGSWYLHVEARDKVGNIRYAYAGPYQIDKTAPSISFSPSSSNWTNGNITVSVSITDSGGSGFSQRRYAWSTSTTAPTSGWSNWESGASFQVTQSSEGVYYLFVEARDVAGNVRQSYGGPYRIDKTVPSVSFSISSRPWANTDVSVTVSASDNASGVSTLQYAWSTSTTTPSSWTSFSSGSALTQSSTGQWYLHIRAIDAAGNTRTTYAGPYQIDKTAPSISFSPSSRSWSSSDASVTVSISDSGGSGFSDRRFAWSTSASKPSSGWSSWTSGSSFTEVRSTEGSSYLHVEARDAAGNTGYAYGGPYQVDKTAPTISFSPSSTNWSTSASVTISVSDSLSGPKDIRYAWSTSTSKPSSGWSSWTAGSSLPVTQSSEGTWYLHVEARDSVDNLAYAYAGPYRIDRTAPAISFDVTSAPWGTANVTVSVTVTDSGGSGVNQYRYAWSTSTSRPSSGWTSWVSGSSFAASQSSSGSWYLHVEASDAAGNIGYTYAGPYRIDKDAPSITFGKESSLTPQSVVSVPVTISDGSGSGVKERRYAWSISTAKPSSGWSSWASGSSFTASKAVSGTWYLHVEARDNVDNLRYAYTGPFVVKVHDGLLAWWKLDGNAEDTSGNGFHGTTSGSASFAQGKIGQALSMGSSSGQIITPIPDDSIPDTFTATAWVRIKQWGLSQGVFGTRDGSTNTGFMLYRNSDEADGLLRTYLHYTNTSGTSTTTSHSYTGFPLNEWFHVAVVRGPGYYKIYFNGQLVGSTTLSNFQYWNKGSTTFRIGSGGTGYASAQMDVDDVRLYDRELSEKEIKELAKGKILHYKFDTHQDGVIQDASGFGYHSRVDATSSPSWSSDSSLGSGAYDFRPTSTQNNIIRIPGVPGDFGSFTLTAWIKPRSTGVLKHIVGWAIGNNSNRSMILNHNKLAFHDYSTYSSNRNYPSLSDVITLNSWQFCAVTYDRGTIKIYHNGVLVGQHQDQLNPATGDLIIGSPINNISDWSRAFDGLIDDVRIYATALSDEDIKELYQQRASIDSLGNVFAHELVEVALTSGPDAFGRMKSEFVSEVGVVEGLLAWYPFDDNVEDLSGNKLHAILNGPVAVPAFRGKLAYAFDGADDYVTIPNFQYPAAWADPLSIAVWIYVPSDATWSNGYLGNIVARGTYAGSHGLIRGTTDNQVRMWVRGSNTSLSAFGSIQRNTWHHIVGTWDGQTVRLYIDGVLVNSSSATLEGTPTSADWDVGRARAYSGDSGNWYKGRITDLRIYRRALSPQEVGILYKATRPNPVLMQQTASGLYIAGQFIEV